MMYEYLKVTETEREILWRGEVACHQHSYGRTIDACKVEILVNELGHWAYRIHTHKKTILENEPGVIQSKYKFAYQGKAETAAREMIELYWMQCNETD